MNTGPIEIISVLTLLFGSLFGAFIVSAVRATKRNNAQPVRTVRVQVITTNEGFFQRNTSHAVDFRAEDGEIIKLSVTDDAAYVQMTQGLKGTLTFRGWNYINFDPR